MENTTKICFISHSSSNGGAENAFPKLLEGLQQKGIKAYVLLPSKGPLISDLKKRNIEYSVIPYKLWMAQNPSFFGKVKRTFVNFIMFFFVAFKIWKWKCELVYTNTSTVCVGAFSAKILGLPHIWHFREFGYEDHGFVYDLKQSISEKITNRLSTICLVNSNAVAEKYKKNFEIFNVENFIYNSNVTKKHRYIKLSITF